MKSVSLNTFLWQAPALAKPGLSVQQFALGASWWHRRPPCGVSIIAEGVTPARVPRRVLPQPPFGLGLQTRLMDVAAGGGDPVAIDLVVDVPGRGYCSSILLITR